MREPGDLVKEQCLDAREWAECFCENIHPDGLDVDVIHTWFANAMMTMHDSIFNNAIQPLQAENKKLRKCVEFYAKPNGSRVHTYTTHTMYLNDIETITDAGWVLKLKGKLARKTLKEIDNGAE